MSGWMERLWNRLVEDLGRRFDVVHWSQYVQHLFDSLLIVLAAALVIWLARRLLRRIEIRIEKVRGAGYRRKIETATSLAGSTVKYIIFIAAATAILATWGAVEASTLAFGSAAIGAALGFGSQGLVQDVITGLSILAEDQLAVGDFVEVGGKTGVVEEIGLRVIKLRDPLGVQHVIFNRTIASVSDYTSGAVQAVVDVSLEKAEDGEAAQRVAAQVCRDMAAELPYFHDVPVVEGVRQTSTHDVFLRIHLRIVPQQQDTARDLFVDRLKRAFATGKIAIPDGRIRVVIVSDLFRKALSRAKPGALPTGPDKTYEGAV
ncbi:MAG: mechanosensitive ion channel [Planctomycetota bacterium]|nr:mechanosensitive ion channel [Planctomycetota bacterium]